MELKRFFAIILYIVTSIAFDAMAMNPEEEAFESLRHRDIKHFEALVKSNLNLEARDECDTSLLQWAVIYNAWEFVRLLLDAKADPNAKRHRSLIEKTIRNPDIRQLIGYLQCRELAPVNYCGDISPLNRFIKFKWHYNSDCRVLHWFDRSGADNTKALKVTLRHREIQNVDNLILFLLARGAKINKAMRKKILAKNPQLAARIDHIQHIEKSIGAGTHLQSLNKKLHRLIDQRGPAKLTEIADVLNRGAHIDALDAGGRSPLYKAVAKNDRRLARLLSRYSSSSSFDFDHEFNQQRVPAIITGLRKMGLPNHLIKCIYQLQK